MNKDIDINDIYPYKRYYLDIDKLVDKAYSYKPKVIEIYSSKDSVILAYKKRFNSYPVKYKGKFMFILTDDKDDLDDKSSYNINDITDYFTEHCRVSTCHREYDNITPFEYFNKNKIEIATVLENNGLDISFKNLNDYMEKKIKAKPVKVLEEPIPVKVVPSEPIPALCSNYKLTYLLGILKQFKPKRWLDMSAGWGDRLCSAYLSDSAEYYYGIDPSCCLNSNLIFGYEAIMNYFQNFQVSKSSKSLKAYIHKGPAETSPLLPKIYPELKSYDFIFTSPPFFTFELYGVQDGVSEQSTNQYKSIDLWLNNFLFKTIDRSWELLEKGGNYLMYIEDKPQYRFIDRMLNFMKSKRGCVYDGIIYQVFHDPKYPKNPYVFHTVYCFRKQ
jgi:hypothetical protein